MRPILQRAGVFALGFVIFSGVLGPQIIARGLVGHGVFAWYGYLGKILLVALAVFVLLLYRRGTSPAVLPWQRAQAGWFVAAAGSAAAAWFADGIVVHAAIAAGVASLGLGSFGWRNMCRIAKFYTKELWLAAAIGAGFFGLLCAVYASWPMLAGATLRSVKYLLETGGLHTAVVPPDMLVLDKFAVSVTKYCSGVESLALFCCLYGFVSVLDWHRLNHARLAALFLPALALLFACNIARIYVLILAAYYVNQHIAFGLFHTYAGLMFFAAYAGLFWAAAYKWLTKRAA